MKIVYLGTPDFAVPALHALVEKGYRVVAAVTQPDRPVGRKQIMTPSPVKVAAGELGIPVFQYEKIRKEGVEDLTALAPDLMVTCAFGQILSREILEIPKFGVINIHASLLPRYRGAAPIQWAVINGEKRTGITIMQTETGIDTGAILLQREIEIGEDETAGELFGRLSVLGAEAVTEAIERIASGTAVWEAQDEALATHVKMLSKEDGKIDFGQTSEAVKNLVRGVNPWPGAYAFRKGEMLKIWEVKTVPGKGKPGEILAADPENGFVIACGEGAVGVISLQPAGKRRMAVSEFLRGNAIPVGTFLQ